MQVCGGSSLHIASFRGLVIISNMKKRKPKRRSDCPVNYVAELLGDKWSLIVIRDLMFKDKHRYQEFLQSKEKISTNILADRLSKMEANGLITKTVDPNNLKKTTYHLTITGINLLPAMVELIKWSVSSDVLSTGSTEEAQLDIPEIRAKLMDQLSAA